MDQKTIVDINGLLVRFSELHERWESDADAFDWAELKSLAQEGAHAYNEQSGPSFHSLALDGVQHSVFHERFLDYSIEAGFDPFRLVTADPQMTPLPVIAHDSLAEEAATNPSSARMHGLLKQLARARFGPMLDHEGKGAEVDPSELYQVFQVCAESIPSDLLRKVAPEMAKHAKRPDVKRRVNPEEGYLSTAETIIDSQKPYG